MAHKQLHGVIVSDKMTKTVVVKVTVSKQHPKYHKRYTVYRKYKADNPENQYHTGEVVEIEECQPLSREKRWKVVRKLT